MDLKKEIRIDLGKYGAEGEIVLRTPTLRKIIELKNARSRYASVKINRDNMNEGTGIIADEGDLDVLAHMAYVASAPFKTTVQGFLGFTDKLDAECPGAGLALWNEIAEGVEKIDEEPNSPFVSSPGAEKETSE